MSDQNALLQGKARIQLMSGLTLSHTYQHNPAKQKREATSLSEFTTILSIQKEK